MRAARTVYRPLWLIMAASVLPILISGCATRPAVPDDLTEAFVLQEDLLGDTVGRGNFSAIDGTSRDFVAYINGSWDGNVMTLVEDFDYADGVKERKTWTLTQLPNGEFSGVREDVIGTARGYQDGKAFRLDYTMAIPNDDGTPGRKVTFKDVLVKLPNGDISNEANVGLWGFRVGRVSLKITRE